MDQTKTETTAAAAETAHHQRALWTIEWMQHGNALGGSSERAVLVIDVPIGKGDAVVAALRDECNGITDGQESTGDICIWWTIRQHVHSTLYPNRHRLVLIPAADYPMDRVADFAAVEARVREIVADIRDGKKRPRTAQPGDPGYVEAVESVLGPVCSPEEAERRTEAARRHLAEVGAGGAGTSLTERVAQCEDPARREQPIPVSTDYHGVKLSDVVALAKAHEQVGDALHETAQRVITSVRKWEEERASDAPSRTFGPFAETDLLAEAIGLPDGTPIHDIIRKIDQDRSKLAKSRDDAFNALATLRTKLDAVLFSDTQYLAKGQEIVDEVTRLKASNQQCAEAIPVWARADEKNKPLTPAESIRLMDGQIHQQDREIESQRRAFANIRAAIPAWYQERHKGEKGSLAKAIESMAHDLLEVWELLHDAGLLTSVVGDITVPEAVKRPTYQTVYPALLDVWATMNEQQRNSIRDIVGVPASPGPQPSTPREKPRLSIDDLPIDAMWPISDDLCESFERAKKRPADQPHVRVTVEGEMTREGLRLQGLIIQSPLGTLIRADADPAVREAARALIKAVRNVGVEDEHLVAELDAIRENFEKGVFRNVSKDLAHEVAQLQRAVRDMRGVTKVNAVIEVDGKALADTLTTAETPVASTEQQQIDEVAVRLSREAMVAGWMLAIDAAAKEVEVELKTCDTSGCSARKHIEWAAKGVRKLPLPERLRDAVTSQAEVLRHADEKLSSLTPSTMGDVRRGGDPAFAKHVAGITASGIVEQCRIVPMPPDPTGWEEATLTFGEASIPVWVKPECFVGLTVAPCPSTHPTWVVLCDAWRTCLETKGTAPPEVTIQRGIAAPKRYIVSGHEGLPVARTAGAVRLSLSPAPTEKDRYLDLRGAVVRYLKAKRPQIPVADDAPAHDLVTALDLEAKTIGQPTAAEQGEVARAAEEHEARREAIEGELKRLRWEEAMADETLHVRHAWEIVCKPPLPHAPVTRPDETLIDVVKRVVRTTSLEERESLKAQAPRPDGRHPNKIYVDAIQDIHRLLDLAPGVDVVAGVKALVTALCPRPGENVTAAAARLAMVSVRMDAIGEDYEDIFAAREALGARRGETLAAAARRAANLLTRLQALGTEAKTVLSAKGPKSASSSQNETSASD